MLKAKGNQMKLPWSEQKKPCRHLEHDSFDDASVAGGAVGAETGVLGFAFDNTGFSVVCLPVLQLHSHKKQNDRKG